MSDIIQRTAEFGDPIHGTMNTPADPYKAVEPVLDGYYICLPFLKDVVCPGTFVLFSGGDRFGDCAVGWIITVTKNSVIMLNPFQAPNEEDGIAPSTILTSIIYQR